MKNKISAKKLAYIKTIYFCFLYSLVLLAAMDSKAQSADNQMSAAEREFYETALKESKKDYPVEFTTSPNEAIRYNNPNVSYNPNYNMGEIYKTLEESRLKKEREAAVRDIGSFIFLSIFIALCFLAVRSSNSGNDKDKT